MREYDITPRIFFSSKRQSISLRLMAVISKGAIAPLINFLRANVRYTRSVTRPVCALQSRFFLEDKKNIARNKANKQPAMNDGLY